MRRPCLILALLTACDGGPPVADASALRACEAILPAQALTDACGVDPVWVDPDMDEWNDPAVACARWLAAEEPAADADGVIVELRVHADAVTARGHLLTRLAELGGGSPRAGRAPGLTVVDEDPELGDGGYRLTLEGLDTRVDDSAGSRDVSWNATGTLFALGRATALVLAKDHDNGRVQAACDAQGVEALTWHLVDAITDPPAGASAVPDREPPALEAGALLTPEGVAATCHATLPKADTVQPAGTSWRQAFGGAELTVRVTRLGSAEAAAAALYDLHEGLVGEAAPTSIDGVGDASFATVRHDGAATTRTTCGRAGPVVLELLQTTLDGDSVPCSEDDAAALLAEGLSAAMSQLADGYAPSGPEDVVVPTP